MRVQVVEKFLDISSFNHVKRMEQLCAPLKKIGIECFAYVEYLNGNKMRWLINDVIFLELWAEFERSCFSHSAFSNQLTDKSGLYFLDSIYSIKPPCLTPEFFECCDVATGVAIVEREKAIKRVYFFSSNNVARFHANYHQLQALFYRFINFFKREARDLIMQSNYFLIPKAYLDVAQCLEYPKLLLSSDVNAFLEVVADKQHSLEKIASQYQLTYREQECLSHLLKGASAKQVAEAMGISLRTAEHHIQNVREKTQSPSIKDLLIKMAVTMAQQGEDQHV